MSNVSATSSTPTTSLVNQTSDVVNTSQVQNSYLNNETEVPPSNTTNREVSTPTLPPPQLPSSEEIQSAGEKVSYLLTNNDVLADIFQLLSLLHTTMQTQRTVARDMRLIDRQLQMQELSNQVDKLRSAAVTAMVMGLASAAVSLGMATQSAIKLGQGMKQQFSVNRVQQYQMANTKLAAAQTKVANLEAKIKNIAPNAKGLDAQGVEAKGGVAAKNVVDAQSKDIGRPRSQSVGEPKGVSQLDSTRARSKSVDNVKPGKDNIIEKDLKELAGAKQNLKQCEADVKTIEKKLSPQDKKLLAEAEKFGVTDKIENPALQQAQLESNVLLKQVDINYQVSQGISQGMGGVGQGIQGFQQADATAAEGRARQAESRAQESGEWMQEMRDALRSVEEKFQAIQQSQNEMARKIMAA